MVDLHTHTNNSDGSKSTIDLLKEAEQNQIKFLSITDHNTLKAYEDIEKLDLSNYYTGKLINGVEITTIYNGEVIEVLAYNFNIKKMKQYFRTYNIDIDYKEKCRKRYEKIKEEYLKKGIKFDYDLYNENNNMTNTVIYNELIKHPENDNFYLNINNKKTRTSFIRNEIYNPKSKFYINQIEFYPSLEIVLNIIKDSNGLSFLAHPYIYSKNIINCLENMLKEYPFDGIECFYTTFTDKQVEHLLLVANKYNIYVSGGSDYHGENKVNHFIGNYTKDNSIVYEYLKKWYKE